MKAPRLVVVLTVLSSILGALAATAQTPPDSKTLVDRLTAAATILREWTATLPADPRDHAPILAATGSDPAAITAWVRTQTGYVPYRGKLRGGDGVLMDRSGNALDRALLLAALLADGGHEVRIARAEISAQAAAAIIDAPAATFARPTLDSAATDALAQALNGNAVLDRNAMAEMNQAAQAADASAAAAFADRFATLEDEIVTLAGQPADAATARQHLVDAARDHFWVQVKSGETWTDLDPTLGTAPPPPAATFAANEIPEDLHHRVTIRLVVEIWGEDAPAETVLVSATRDAADMTDRIVRIGHSVSGYPSLNEIAATANPTAALQQGLVMAGGWAPVIAIGEERIVDKAFSHDGRIGPGSSPDLTGTREAIEGSTSQAIGELGGEAGPPPATPTAEWIEIVISAPGEPDRVERRTIFDIVGPARRAAGTKPELTEALAAQRGIQLAGTVQALIVPATPNEVFMARTMARDLSAAYATTAELIAAKADPDTAATTYVPAFPAALYGYAAARLDPDALPNSVQIALLHETLSLSADGTLTTGRLFDIVANRLEGRQADRFAAHVRTGVRDAIAEYFLTGAPAAGSLNAAAAYAGDRAAGRAWRLLSPSDLAVVAALEIDADARERIAGDLRRGYMVLAPQSASATVGAAWWRIDPATGDTLSVGANGAGASMVDYAKRLQWFLAGGCVVQAYQTLGKTLAKGIDESSKGSYVALAITCSAATTGGSVVLAGRAGMLGASSAVKILIVLAGIAGAGSVGGGLM